MCRIVTSGDITSGGMVDRALAAQPRSWRERMAGKFSAAVGASFIAGDEA